MNNATAPTEEAISIYVFFMYSGKVVITDKFILINISRINRSSAAVVYASTTFDYIDPPS